MNTHEETKRENVRQTVGDKQPPHFDCEWLKGSTRVRRCARFGLIVLGYV